MADDTAIIEGAVKFREGKKWKPRWLVMRRLSPVADCVQLQVYAAAGARRAARWGAGEGEGKGEWVGAVKAALSLEQFVGAESGFTLERQSHTLALVCRDHVAVLALESRERLLAWQAKARRALPATRQFVVLVGGAPRRALRGPARLHVRDQLLALTTGVPPRLQAVWEIAHLRRYGVVEGRFCFEGGSRCGKGEGLHVLLSDRPTDIADAVAAAAGGQLSPLHRRVSIAQRSEVGVDGDSPPGFRAERRPAEQSAARPAELRLGAGACDGDVTSLRGATPLAAPREGWAAATLQRCASCMSKLGALSRSSTAVLTPAAPTALFNPAWTMDAPAAASPADHKPPPTTETPSAGCGGTVSIVPDDDGTRSCVGPYENYDVPRLPSSEVEGEFYDTPKRLRDCLDDELFKIARGSAADAIILKKSCGCLLRVGRKKVEPTVVETEENFQPADCPCRRVTEWANSWIKLPYCRRTAPPSDSESSATNKENVTPNGCGGGGDALYATVDVSRKARRRTWAAPALDEGPLAHYENLSFALSLEHYENAKDLLRRAGVTREELAALGANLRAPLGTCASCGHGDRDTSTDDEYLLMDPKGGVPSRGAGPPAGYTPMSPVGNFAFHTLRLRARAPLVKPLDEKSASNPALGALAADCGRGDDATVARRDEQLARAKRSSSADSSRFLDDVEEFDGSAASRGSSSSLETLRGAGGDAVGGGGAAPGGGAPGTAAGGGNRDSSSSADSGVASWSARELPRTSAAARRHWRHAARRPPAAGDVTPRRARSQGPAFAPSAPLPPKSSSAEAEVPVLPNPLTAGCGTIAVGDSRSTSSGASDMSDYVETLSLCSSHSSGDAPHTTRTCLLRPRSGREYGLLLRAPPPPPPPRPPRAPP